MNRSEQFFVDKVTGKVLILDAVKGTCYNTKTKRSVGATSKTGGYPKYSMLESGPTKKIHHIQLHRLVWLVHRGSIDVGMEINHINGNRDDYRLCNLEKVTHSENIKHSVATGLLKGNAGHTNSQAGFSISDVGGITAMAAEGRSLSDIMSVYGCSRRAARDVLSGKRYKNTKIIAGTITALTRLSQTLKTRGARPIQSKTTFLHRNHLLWMCEFSIDSLENDIENFPIDKASRWLGYIQGVMASIGDLNVMDERNATRPLFT